MVNSILDHEDIVFTSQNQLGRLKLSSLAPTRGNSAPNADRVGKYSDTRTQLCPVGCGNTFTRRGMGHHIKACRRKFQNAERDEEYERKCQEAKRMLLKTECIAEEDEEEVPPWERLGSKARRPKEPVPPIATQTQSFDGVVDDDEVYPWERPRPRLRISHIPRDTEATSRNLQSNNGPNNPNKKHTVLSSNHSGLTDQLHSKPSQAANIESPFKDKIDISNPAIDSIQTKNHPNSQRPGNNRERERTINKSPNPPRLFQSQADFDLANLALRACLNKSDFEKLLEIINRVKSGKDSLNITSYDHLQETWEHGARMSPIM